MLPHPSYNRLIRLVDKPHLAAISSIDCGKLFANHSHRGTGTVGKTFVGAVTWSTDCGSIVTSSVGGAELAVGVNGGKYLAAMFCANGMPNPIMAAIIIAAALMQPTSHVLLDDSWFMKAFFYSSLDYGEIETR